MKATSDIQIADAIVALINSRPRSPTREEIMAALRGLVPDNGNDPPPLAPTELGRALIELLPAHAVAVWHGCHCAPDDPDEDAICCWERRTWKPISELSREARNIVDIAIAHRIGRAGEEDPSWDSKYGLDSDVLADRFVTIVLKAAGVSERLCSVKAMWDENGWHHHTPPIEERRAALAQIPDAELEGFRRELAEVREGDGRVA
jgi:hypothetical protein